MVMKPTRQELEQKVAFLENEIAGHRAALTVMEQNEAALSIVDHAPVFFVAIDPDGKTMMMNPCMLDKLGYTSGEVLGCDYLSTFVPERERDALAGVFRQLTREHRQTVNDNHVIDRDGRELLCEWHGKPVFDGNGEFKHYYGLGIDITEAVRSEERLRRSEERYRMLFDSGNDAVFVHQPDPDGRPRRFIEANQLASEMYGYSRRELLGLTPLDLVDPDCRKEAADQVRQLLHCKQKVFENVHRGKNGRKFPVEISSQLFDLHEVPTVLSIVRDISERRQAERDKRMLMDKLQQAQKMEAIGTLAGGIAHDFNNILSSVIGYAELAQHALNTGDTVDDCLHEVLVAGKRAKDLVAQILAFSRQTESEKKPVLVKRVVKEAVRLLKASLPATIKIRRELDSESLVMGDPTQVHQVVMNLCTNAAHAMQDGGVLDIALRDMTMEEILRREARSQWQVAPAAAGLIPAGRSVVLTVRDTGNGIPEEIVHQIFNPYFTTKPKQEGTGLGLAVVHGIIEDMKGTITVRSDGVVGTEFRVFLPAVKHGPGPDAGRKETMVGGSERILVVDDEKPVMKIEKKLLESLGYEVVATSDSMEALEIFKRRPDRFDLVITDMTMPHLVGTEMAAEMMAVRPDLPVILCTGYNSRIDEAGALRMGLRALIYKPVFKRQLARTVRKVLDGSGAAGRETATPRSHPGELL